MNARASILTIGISLALLAPAAEAAGGKVLGCKVPSKVAGPQTPSVSQGFRALQHVVVGDATATTQSVRTICGKKQIKPAVAPNYYQVLKNSH